MKLANDIDVRIAEWQAATFPTATLKGSLTHLAKEGVEVLREARHIVTTYGEIPDEQPAYRYAVQNLAEECADVVHLLVQATTLLEEEFDQVTEFRSPTVLTMKGCAEEIARLSVQALVDFNEARAGWRRRVMECLNAVFVMVWRISEDLNFSLFEAISSKLTKNKLREWGEPDADGVIEHIEHKKCDATIEWKDQRLDAMRCDLEYGHAGKHKVVV